MREKWSVIVCACVTGRPVCVCVLGPLLFDFTEDYKSSRAALLCTSRQTAQQRAGGGG